MSSDPYKNILLGVSGGIAAYKAAELVRALVRAGRQVRVVMTAAATEFVTPLTFQALSGHPVYIHMSSADDPAAMHHIGLARWADCVLVAPATADFIARLRLGMGDDLLATICLASEVPLLVAPAMNRAMWDNPATRENVEILRQRGTIILGPAAGAQACGENGPGRMLEPDEIAAAVAGFNKLGCLAGRKVLITAGPTREALDPVRFLTNRSSGKMGYAIAEAAVKAGAEVRLVSGPVSLPAATGCSLERVESSLAMHQAVMDSAGWANIFIATAAVSDYRPRLAAESKIKKTGETLQLELVRNPDILADVAALPKGPFTVGFAAETDNLRAYALSKLEKKHLDMIAANWVNQPGTGFDTESNALEIFWPGGSLALSMAPKQRIAEQLIELIAERFDAKNTTQNSG